MEHLLPYLSPGAKVLDVGSGSGYLCGVLHHLVSPPPSVQPNPPQGKVIGVDHIPELVEWSKKNLEKDGLGSALRDGKIEMVTGDGREGELPLLSVQRRVYAFTQVIPPAVSVYVYNMPQLIVIFRRPVRCDSCWRCFSITSSSPYRSAQGPR